MSCAVDSSGEASSSESLHPGLQYTSAYYEEEVYNETAEEAPTVCSHHVNVTAPPAPPTPPACENHPVRITDRHAVNIDLPPLEWNGYRRVPRILSLTNTGRTILIDGQWIHGRPYITGGPLNGTYLFSQIHFHSPSEHELNGRRYPLEMHVVHYKTSYLTKERAMQEKDGTVVLVYLFEVDDTNETIMSSLTKLAPKIEKVNSCVEITDVKLEQLIVPFTSKYFVYLGSIMSGKSSYLLQWIVSSSVHSVTQGEANELLNILNECCPTNSKTSRMKPENDTIFYVEEIEQEEKEEEKPPVVNQLEQPVPQGYDYSTCPTPCPKKPEVCRSQPAMVCRSIKSYSGLRLTSPVRPKGKKYCEIRLETKPPSPEACKAKKRVYVQECEEISSKQKICPAEEAISSTTQEAVSGTTEEETSCTTEEATNCPSDPCPSPSDLGIPEEFCIDPCDPNEKVKGVKVKVIRRCPSDSETSCDDKKKKKKICEIKTDIKFKLKKEKKEKKKKKNKTDDCESEGESSASACPSKKSVCKKEKKQEKKSTKCNEDASDKADCPEREEECETKCPKPEKKKKKAENCKEENKEEDKEKCQKPQKEKCPKEKPRKEKECEPEEMKCEIEVPVGCIIATVPEKSFDEILREYDSNWLSESELKIPKTSVLDYDEECDKGSASSKKSNDQGKKAMTTLFEKNRETEDSQVPAEDCGVNFLLKPHDRQSNPSSSTMSPKSVSGEIKCEETESSKKTIDIPETINTATVSAIGVPPEIRDGDLDTNTPNEFSVQVELSYNSKNPSFSESATQEYNLALMYNQNILQEYKGIIQPDALEVGNYEKLDLVPKYPDLGNMSVYLQDCIVKKNASDQIFMRAKFLMKEIQFKYIDLSVNKEGGVNSEKKVLILCDATTQCTLKEVEEFAYSAEVVHDQNPGEEIIERMETLEKQEDLVAHQKDLNEHKEDLHEPSVGSRELKEGSDEHKDEAHEKDLIKCADDKSSASCENVNLPEETQNLNLKVTKKPDADSEESSKKSDSLGELTELKRDDESSKKEDVNKKAVKELKHLFSNRKKTVYFMYEKIEKDENSGKKIFVGSFRPKDEVKCLFKGRKVAKGTNSPDRTEGENKNLLSMESMSDELIESKNSNENDVKPQTTTTSKHSIESKKEVVTLHKFKPKSASGNTSKKDRLSLVVGRALNAVEKDSKNFKRLADLVGLDEEQNSKISVYELQESPEAENTESITNEKEQDSKCKNYVLMSSVSNKKVEKPNEPDPPAGGKKSISKKVSQTAVIIIPVEVESLSKVEVILVEHGENAKRAILKSGKDVIPSLNCTE